jgi:hypothetical protein
MLPACLRDGYKFQILVGLTNLERGRRNSWSKSKNDRKGNLQSLNNMIVKKNY